MSLQHKLGFSYQSGQKGEREVKEDLKGFKDPHRPSRGICPIGQIQAVVIIGREGWRRVAKEKVSVVTKVGVGLSWVLSSRAKCPGII